MGRGRRDGVGVDGGGCEGEAKAKGERLTCGDGGPLGGWRVRRPRGVPPRVPWRGRGRPGKRPGPTARWCGGGGTAERKPEAGGSRQPGRERRPLERGAPSCGETGDGTSGLCGGAGPGPRPAAPRGGAFPERGGPWGLVGEARGERCEAEKSGEDRHWLERL